MSDWSTTRGSWDCSSASKAAIPTSLRTTSLSAAKSVAQPPQLLWTTAPAARDQWLSWRFWG